MRQYIKNFENKETPKIYKDNSITRESISDKNDNAQNLTKITNSNKNQVFNKDGPYNNSLYDNSEKNNIHKQDDINNNDIKIRPAKRYEDINEIKNGLHIRKNENFINNNNIGMNQIKRSNSNTKSNSINKTNDYHKNNKKSHTPIKEYERYTSSANKMNNDANPRTNLYSPVASKVNLINTKKKYVDFKKMKEIERNIANLNNLAKNFETRNRIETKIHSLYCETTNKNNANKASDIPGKNNKQNKTDVEDINLSYYKDCFSKPNKQIEATNINLRLLRQNSLKAKEEPYSIQNYNFDFYDTRDKNKEIDISNNNQNKYININYENLNLEIKKKANNMITDVSNNIHP